MLRPSIHLVVSLILILVIAEAELGGYTQTEHFHVWLRDTDALPDSFLCTAKRGAEPLRRYRHTENPHQTRGQP
jgi:hypothetical protein